MYKLFEAIGRIGVLPVIALERAEDAVPLARALLAGGIDCAEITFRTPAAAEAIRRMSGEVGEMLVGAGTVLTVQQAEQAILAGAQYIVSPGFDAAVVDWCQAQGVAVIGADLRPNRLMGSGYSTLQPGTLFALAVASWARTAPDIAAQGVLTRLLALP